LFELVDVRKKDDISAPRSFGDYVVTDKAEIESNLPEGISLTALYV